MRKLEDFVAANHPCAPSAREAAKTMIDYARQAAGDPQAEITLGADKGYGAKEFIDALQEMNVIQAN